MAKRNTKTAFDTANYIDDKVVQIVKEQHQKARKLLEDNRAKLDEIATYLYEKETITGEEFMTILKGEDVTAVNA